MDEHREIVFHPIVRLEIKAKSVEEIEKKLNAKCRIIRCDAWGGETAVIVYFWSKYWCGAQYALSFRLEKEMNEDFPPTVEDDLIGEAATAYYNEFVARIRDDCDLNIIARYADNIQEDDPEHIIIRDYLRRMENITKMKEEDYRRAKKRCATLNSNIAKDIFNYDDIPF